MPELKMPASLPDPIINENAKIVLQRRYQRKDLDGVVYETVKELFWRVASAIAQEEGKYEKSSTKPAKLARDFYDLMTSYRFLPNSPTLMNAGTDLGQLAACFVLPVED
ncbi:MAG TPA: ribonucleotide reductase N-terminal alpha domain-containing protein, partial [Pseudodesulfovibrio sp.]|nr:ribonucleotide reductase N-terminal alpha domain-containing protein [Pseudodesulfovibrio sp.]